MFQSTLLKRTMSLVVLSLLASAIIATIAFVVAGKTSTLQLEVDNSLSQDIYEENYETLMRVIKKLYQKINGKTLHAHG